MKTVPIVAKTKIAKPSVPLKWHGGKAYLAPWIIPLFPPHLHYVEPYFGGGATLLAHPEIDRSELVNDINGNLVNFWRVLQSTETFPHFARILEAVPLSREEWEDSGGRLAIPDRVARAVAFFIRCRQSMSGRMKSFTPPSRTRTRRQMNGNASEWLGAVEMLPEIHARLKRVFIENMKAVDLIRREDTPGTLFYCDPPYMPDSRTSPDVYEYEMTVEQHEELLGVLLACKGKVALSGYRTELYDKTLAHWTRADFEMPNHSGQGKTKQRRVECVWLNY
jgi:DNA adenine methylase